MMQMAIGALGCALVVLWSPCALAVPFSVGGSVEGRGSVFGTFDASTRYRVTGFAGNALPALFIWDPFAGPMFAARWTARFDAFDLQGNRLVGLEYGANLDDFSVATAHCGPALGSCSVFFDISIGGAGPPPLGGFDPYTISRATPGFPGSEFFTSGFDPQGDLSGHFQELPFFLPVGPGTGIRAGVSLSGVDACTVYSGEPAACQDGGTRADIASRFTLVPLPPPGVSFELQPIPEPTTLLLVGTSAAGLGVASWLKRRRSHRHDHAA